MRSITRWNPRRDVAVADPFSTFEDMVSDMWRNWPTLFSADSTQSLLRPAMDVIENDKDLTVRVDLPGMSSDDVNIEIEDNVLTVSGEIGDTVEQEGDRYHYRERRFGSFQRSLRLPNTIDADKVEAHFENGVLSVVMPKLPQAQPKQIKIKASK